MGKAFAAALGGLLITVSRGAWALTACTAAEFSTYEVGCPAAGDCVVTMSYTIADGCELNFGERNLTLAPSAVLGIGSGTTDIVAHDITLAASTSGGAYINGRGLNGATSGGTIRLKASGTVDIQRKGTTRARVEVSASDRAGTIEIDALGTVTIAGRLRAGNEANSGAWAGTIRVTSGADVLSLPGSQIEADSNDAGVGGVVEISAAAKIDLGDVVDVSGGDAASYDEPVVKLASGADTIVRGVNGSVSGARSAAGTVQLRAGGAVQFLGNPVYLNSSHEVNSDSDAGYLDVEAGGDVVIATSLYLEGRGTLGQGGTIAVTAAGAIRTTPTTTVSLRSYGERGSTGDMELNAATTMTLAGSIDLSGGESAGQLLLEVGTDLSISGPIDLQGLYGFADGGEVDVTAAVGGHGTITISNAIDASSGPCSGPSDRDCPVGGDLSFDTERFVLTSSGRLRARGADGGGAIYIGARQQVRIDGFINALGVGSGASDGNVEIEVGCGKALIAGNVIQPPADIYDSGPACDATPTPTQTPSITVSPGVTSTRTASATSTASIPAPTATPSATPYASATATHNQTATASATVTRTAPMPTPSPTQACVGDCGVDGEVTIEEILLMTGVALGTQDIDACRAGDSGHDGEITIEEILAAVAHALSGCNDS